MTVYDIDVPRFAATIGRTERWTRQLLAVCSAVELLHEDRMPNMPKAFDMIISVDGRLASVESLNLVYEFLAEAPEQVDGGRDVLKVRVRCLDGVEFCRRVGEDVLGCIAEHLGTSERHDSSPSVGDSVGTSEPTEGEPLDCGMERPGTAGVCGMKVGHAGVHRHPVWDPCRLEDEASR